MRLRRGAVLAGLALLAAGLTACGSSGNSGSSSSSASTKGPYVIGFMNILSGPASVPGESDPIDLAAKQLNAKGGIDGRQVEIKAYDVGLTASAALTATRLALSQGVDALIGYPIDAGLTASIGLIKQANVPVLTPLVTVPLL